LRLLEYVCDLQGNSIIDGNVGVSPGDADQISGATLNGVDTGNSPVTGEMCAGPFVSQRIDDRSDLPRPLLSAFVAQAQSDLAVIYSGLVSRGAQGTPIGSALGSTTRYPGVYTNPMYLVNGAQITLDAQGDPDAVFVFVR
jgi:hypothetical protein